MSNTANATPAGPPEPSSWYLVGEVMLVLWEWLPLILMVIHYFLPPLNKTIFEWPEYTGVVIIAASIALAAIWVVVEAIRAAYRTTRTFTLQVDCFRSQIIGGIVIAWGMWLIATSEMQWWFPVGALAALADMFITPLVAINNAAQKPFIPGKGDT